MDTLAKVIFWFFFSVFGIGLADMAMDLQNQAIKAYQKGPISAGQFTRMMTGGSRK